MKPSGPEARATSGQITHRANQAIKGQARGQGQHEFPVRQRFPRQKTPVETRSFTYLKSPPNSLFERVSFLLVIWFASHGQSWMGGVSARTFGARCHSLSAIVRSGKSEHHVQILLLRKARGIRALPQDAIDRSAVDTHIFLREFAHEF